MSLKIFFYGFWPARPCDLLGCESVPTVVRVWEREDGKTRVFHYCAYHQDFAKLFPKGSEEKTDPIGIKAG